MVQIFVYLLLRANVEDRQWQGIPVGRGQLITSNAAMSEDLGLSAQQIRTCIKRLISTGEITYKSTNRYVIITICNYEKYQESRSVSNEQPTSNQRATNEQSTTLKEDKEDNNTTTTSICEFERNFVQDMKNDTYWCEVMAMRFHLGAVEPIFGWLDKFALDTKCREVTHRDLIDAKRHFNDWLRIQLEKANRNGKTDITPRNTTEARVQRAEEFANHIAQKLTGC